MRNCVWERYKMARKSRTELNSSVYKPRDDTAFNPFYEAQKVLAYSEEAGRLGVQAFTVVVDRGLLGWIRGKLPKSFPGFIAVIDRAKLEAGLTNREWRRLEHRIAIEMYKQRKAW